MFEGTHPDNHKQLTSFLFMVVNALIWQSSRPLAIQYFNFTTAKGNLPLYIASLTSIALSMNVFVLSVIGRMLVAPQRQELRSFFNFVYYGGLPVLDELFTNYDHQLGASESLDPNFVAIPLMLSEYMYSSNTRELQNLNLKLQNPWLRLAARVVAQLDIPDESGLPVGLFHDHQVHNMIAALSLWWHTQGPVTKYRETLLLASFLEFWEHVISSLALEYYMKTVRSHSDPSSPSCYLSTAVSAAFNFILPDHQLQMGWSILDIFVDGFEPLSFEWQRIFAEGFFALSRQLLLRPWGGMESSTPEGQLNEILTWEYFNKEEQEILCTDSEFSRLDWMAMALSLHLSQWSLIKTEDSGQGGAQSQDLSTLAVDEEFMLRALCKLLDAAPYNQIIPIIPKLCKFVQWFDDTELFEYCCMISTCIRESVHRHQEFGRFHCMWYF